MVSFGKANCKAQLKWHIESRGRGPRSVKLDARKVVYGVFAALNQIADEIQTAAIEGYLQSGSRDETKCTDSGNISEEEALELFVIRNVDKYRSRSTVLFWLF